MDFITINMLLDVLALIRYLVTLSPQQHAERKSVLVEVTKLLLTVRREKGVYQAYAWVNALTMYLMDRDINHLNSIVDGIAALNVEKL